MKLRPLTFLILSLLYLLLISCQEKGTKNMYVYLGTYTSADSQGIEVYQFDGNKGRLHFVKIIPGIENPSYLRFSPKADFLYAVNELTQWKGKPQGAVSAFLVNKKKQELRQLNQVSSHGRAPCYLSISKSGRFVLVNNYLDGTVVSYATREDGGLGQVISLLKFQGSSIVKKRQETSHVHSIVLNPQNTFAVVADLGTDKLTVLSFDATSGKLELVKGRTISTTPGAGPRHSVFSKDGKYLYVANELNNSVEVFSFDPGNGHLARLQTIPTIPADFNGNNYPADIHLSPDGRFLYVSNRGHESIAVFSVNASDGKLTFVGTDSVYGSWPRNFALSPDGKFLMVANQKSKNLVVFRRNQQDGRLKKIDEIATVAAPACIAFCPR